MKEGSFVRAAMPWVTMGLAGGLALVPAARAAELKLRSLDSRVISVALFKNGLAFVIREAELPRAEARVRLEGLPVPVHGTFWAWSPGRPEAVRRLVAFLEPRKTTAPALSLADLLLANAGRDVEVTFNDGRTVRGRVVAPEDRAPAGDAAPGAPHARALPMIAVQGGTVAFDPSAMQRLQVLGAPPYTEIDRQEAQAALELEAAGGADAKLQLIYLSRGATWSPSYSVELVGKDKARVTAKAEIINELEDLDGADVRLVTGYPNVAFSGVEDPIAMRGDLAAFLAALGARGGARELRNSVMSQSIALDELREAAPAYSTQPPAGERADEMFLYPLPNFSLARGRRAYVPLFSVDAAAEHLYELNLDDRVRDDRFEPTPGAAQAPLEIWHSVRLANSGTVPWTTAPAMATRGGALVAQDVLSYAAPGATTKLRITRVTDLLAEADEFEIARKPRAVEVYGHVYDEITVRGVAEVASFRDEDVTVSVTKNLTGEVLSTTPEAKVDRSAQRLFAENPTSVLHWSLPLKARSKITLEYRYKVLIRI